MIRSGLVSRLVALLAALLVAPIAGASGTPLLAAASAAPAAYTYDASAYVYDALVLLSSPDTVTRDARGSTAGPGVGPRVSYVAVGRFGVAANTAARTDFIASADGVVVPTSRSRLVAGFEDAGLPSTPTTSAGTQYTLPDGSLVRVMEPSGQAGCPGRWR